MEGNNFSELRSLIERKDISGFGKILYDVATAATVKEQCPQDVLQAAALVQSQWIATLAAGDTIDICVAPFLTWYTARLLRKEQVGDQKESSLFYLHYMGWSKDKDETVDLAKCHCLPAYTMTKQKKKAPIRRKTFFYLEPIAEPEMAPPPTNAPPVAPSAPESAEKTQSIPPAHPPSQQQEQQLLSEEKREEEDQGKTKGTSQKPKKVKNLVEEADWICTECGDMEAPDESDLLLCEGGCKRSFHLLCLGIISPTEREKIIAGDAWVCDDCRRHRHTCAICHDEGDDDTACFSSLLDLDRTIGGHQMPRGLLWKILPLQLPHLTGQALHHQT
jgi:hypothetical protein